MLQLLPVNCVNSFVEQYCNYNQSPSLTQKLSNVANILPQSCITQIEYMTVLLYSIQYNWQWLGLGQGTCLEMAWKNNEIRCETKG